MYTIIRFFQDGNREIIAKGKTLEQAQEHCQRDDTHGIIDGIRFFDGYREENTNEKSSGIQKVLQRLSWEKE